MQVSVFGNSCCLVFGSHLTYSFSENADLETVISDRSSGSSAPLPASDHDQ